MRNECVEVKQLYFLNLTFFSAEDEGRTEKATDKKREDARKKGQVAKSQELNTAVLIVGFCAFMLVLAGYMLNNIEQMVTISINGWTEALKQTEVNYFYNLTGKAIMDIIITSAPLWGGLFLIAFLICYIQVGYKPSGKPFEPKFSKMDPLSGLKRIFSAESGFKLLISVGKVIILGYIVYSIIQSRIPTFLKFYDFAPRQILFNLGSTVIYIGFYVGGAFLILSVLDYLYQKHKHEESIKMTKQEVKEEYKNMEGDPQIKGKIKQKMREASMKRMMQAVPEADVIITNPTHFAVAIKYDAEKNSAPIVTAKGVDYVAQKIKEKAKESHIQIVENKPLARALYYTVDLGKEVPPELYGAVAEVLAFVYNLNQKKVDRRK
ncbi:flagellar biosynthesis protein FlhB [Sporanaerobium hydrogeniformans]|uniref:Flagellar biosynthesis protein FlhB n=1 Tax=Sporanaerobium hydrogeniformans TaxID=3072179 RepID=A0AC61DFW8_9FIRM|nr:flagellar biosynthesis protein FlhB [Sporanaerobium hydrogeniformans]PHV71758.1 flagellar biosynthesis protein FlhB [Sporanaerobium hydrogeniformans]